MKRYIPLVIFFVIWASTLFSNIAYPAQYATVFNPMTGAQDYTLVTTPTDTTHDGIVFYKAGTGFTVASSFTQLTPVISVATTTTLTVPQMSSTLLSNTTSTGLWQTTDVVVTLASFTTLVGSGSINAILSIDTGTTLTKYVQVNGHVAGSVCSGGVCGKTSVKITAPALGNRLVIYSSPSTTYGSMWTIEPSSSTTVTVL